jgi:hypothetical protein
LGSGYAGLNFITPIHLTPLKAIILTLEKRFVGHYKISAQAFHTELARLVALKVIRPMAPEGHDITF